MRGVTIAAVLAAGLTVSACAADPNTFYPGTASGEHLLEQRAVEHVPAAYKVKSVTVVKEWGHATSTVAASWSGIKVGSGLGNDAITGYNAWVRVEGCKGYVLVRFDSWGYYKTTADMTECKS